MPPPEGTDLTVPGSSEYLGGLMLHEVCTHIAHSRAESTNEPYNHVQEPGRDWLLLRVGDSATRDASTRAGCSCADAIYMDIEK